MSYQIVILNGERRGTRFDVGGTALTIGRHTSCDLSIPDPLISDVHASLVPAANGLVITPQSDTHQLSLNNVKVLQAAPLKHGDIIEIGSTRLFVQAQQPLGTWDNLAELRKWRKGFTVGIPLLLLISTLIMLKRCAPSTPPEAIPAPAPRHPHSSLMTDTNNTDWMVTNVPCIAIHSSIILTALPPEIIEAKEMVLQTASNHITEEIERALKEVEFAVRFLDQAAQPPLAEPVTPGTGTASHARETNQANDLKN